MAIRVRRRSVLAVAATGVAGPALAACGGGPGHAKRVAAQSAPPAASGAMPRVVMIIRHAEKPEGSGKPYGITDAGERDEESLTVRGWTRAGALIELFDPCGAGGVPVAPRAGIYRPATIFASEPHSHGSKRPQQTVTPLAQALGLRVDVRFAKGQEAELVTALAGARGPVLIGWQHESIGAIIEHLGAVTPTPPQNWPGARFDMVYVFTRNGDGWNFTQVPELLLAGDSIAPIS